MLTGIVRRILLGKMARILKRAAIMLFWRITGEGVQEILKAADWSKDEEGVPKGKVLSVGGEQTFFGHRQRRFVLLFTTGPRTQRPEGFKKSMHLFKQRFAVDGTEPDSLEVVVHVWVNTMNRDKWQRFKKQGRIWKLKQEIENL